MQLSTALSTAITTHSRRWSSRDMVGEVGCSALGADLLLHSAEGLHVRRLAVGAVVEEGGFAVRSE